MVAGPHCHQCGQEPHAPYESCATAGTEALHPEGDKGQVADGWKNPPPDRDGLSRGVLSPDREAELLPDRWLEGSDDKGWQVDYQTARRDRNPKKKAHRELSFTGLFDNAPNSDPYEARQGFGDRLGLEEALALLTEDDGTWPRKPTSVAHTQGRAASPTDTGSPASVSLGQRRQVAEDRQVFLKLLDDQPDPVAWVLAEDRKKGSTPVKKLLRRLYPRLAGVSAQKGEPTPERWGYPRVDPQHPNSFRVVREKIGPLKGDTRKAYLTAEILALVAPPQPQLAILIIGEATISQNDSLRRMQADLVDAWMADHPFARLAGGGESPFQSVLALDPAERRAPKRVTLNGEAPPPRLDVRRGVSVATGSPASLPPSVAARP
jgi:hypothetical protein